MPRVSIAANGLLIGKADTDENTTGRTYQVVDDAAYWVLVDAKVAAEIAAAVSTNGLFFGSNF